MGREIGHEKTGGRAKGTPNKTTSELRTMLQEIITDNYDKFKQDLKELKPRERVDVLLKIFGMIVPRYNNIRLNEEDKTISAREMLENIINYENLSKNNNS